MASLRVCVCVWVTCCVSVMTVCEWGSFQVMLLMVCTRPKKYQENTRQAHTPPRHTYFELHSICLCLNLPLVIFSLSTFPLRAGRISQCRVCVSVCVSVSVSVSVTCRSPLLHTLTKLSAYSSHVFFRS